MLVEPITAARVTYSSARAQEGIAYREAQRHLGADPLRAPSQRIAYDPTESARAAIEPCTHSAMGDNVSLPREPRDVERLGGVPRRLTSNEGHRDRSRRPRTAARSGRDIRTPREMICYSSSPLMHAREYIPPRRAGGLT